MKDNKIKRAERNEQPPALSEPEGRAIEILIFWSFVPEWWSKMIVRITGRQLPDKSDNWSHMGIIFLLENGESEYYEALFDEGFIGPKPLPTLVDKIHNKNGLLAVRETGIKEIYVQEIYERCQSWVGKKGYYQWQLALMWFYERIGRFIGWKIPHSPDKVVCSEVVARLVYPHLDLRDEIRKEMDEVNPNSGWRKYLRIIWNEKHNIAGMGNGSPSAS